jgi:hypothetical protein
MIRERRMLGSCGLRAVAAASIQVVFTSHSPYPTNRPRSDTDLLDEFKRAVHKAQSPSVSNTTTSSRVAELS